MVTPVRATLQLQLHYFCPKMISWYWKPMDRATLAYSDTFIMSRHCQGKWRALNKVILEGLFYNPFHEVFFRIKLYFLYLGRTVSYQSNENRLILRDWLAGSGKRQKWAIVVQLMSEHVGLKGSCTTTKKWPNLYYFPLLDYGWESQYLNRPTSISIRT